MAAKRKAKENIDPELDDFVTTSTKRSKKFSFTRFKPPCTNEEMAVVAKGFVPKNTHKNDGWAMRVFSAWRAERNRNFPDEPPVPEDLLENIRRR